MATGNRWIDVVLLVLACGAPGTREVATPPASPSPGPPASPPPSASPPATPQPVATKRIVLAFLLDPRLFGGTYGGEVWVSPATYVGVLAQDVVEVRAAGVDANGGPIDVSPEWLPSDPDMVTVSPGRGARVTIRVTRAGESRLVVRWQELARDLAVRATAIDGRILQLEISQ